MKVRFLGAIDHITGSCTMFNHNDGKTQFLVDCGLYQGNTVEKWNNNNFPFKPSNLSFVLLTHAHIDHCGLIPRLYKEGFTGKVICTRATAKLAKIQLYDAVKHSNGLYSHADVSSIKFEAVDDKPDWTWGKPFIAEHNIQVTFARSSHILGAASIGVSWHSGENKEPKTFWCSGDLGNNSDSLSYMPALKSNMTPFDTVEFLLLESTYGNRSRDDKYKSSVNRKEALHQVVRQTIDRGGKVVIPAFSMQRAQDLLIDFWSIINSEYTPDNSSAEFKSLKLLFHSPMIANINQVFFDELLSVRKTKKGDKKLYEGGELRDYVDDDRFEDRFEYLFNTISDSGVLKGRCRSKFDNDKELIIDVVGDSKVDINNYDVVVSSSGMCEGGNVLRHLEKIKHDPLSTIVLTGYQTDGSRGSVYQQRAVEELAPHTESEADQPSVVDLSKFYSGHADQKVLMDYIFHEQKSGSRPLTVLINHGATKSKVDLKKAIEERAEQNNTGDRTIKSVIIAETGHWLNLNNMEMTSADQAAAESSDNTGAELTGEEVGRLAQLENRVHSQGLLIDLLAVKIRKLEGEAGTGT